MKCPDAKRWASPARLSLNQPDSNLWHAIIRNGTHAVQGKSGPVSEAKSFKPVALTAIAVAVLLAALLVASVLGFGPFSNKSERDQTVLLKSVRNVSQYHAAVGNFEILLDEKEDTDGPPDSIAGRRTLFVAAGTVNAYVDFAGLAEEDLTLSADGKSVTLRLPEPQLGKPNIDHERSYVYSQDRGIADRVVDAFTAPQQSPCRIRHEQSCWDF